MLLPFSNKRSAGIGSTTILAGDVGASKTNLALFRMQKENIVTLKEADYPSKQYKSFITLLNHFLKDSTLPDTVCIGVAGPVFNGNVKLTNLSWQIDTQEIASGVGVGDVHLINDLEATAYGLAMLTEKEITVVLKGGNSPYGNAAIIAPGTGLGEAGLFWDGAFYHPFATEGGHCDFAARDKFDFELYEYLNQKFGHVSWERLLCGPGIFNIYQFLRDEKKYEEPTWLAQKIDAGDASAIISQHVEESAICKETMQLFVRYLAYESANLVLKLKATGGLFIGGGIAPRIIHLIDPKNFRSFFRSSGRLNHLLEKVPVKIIENPKAALLGAAFYGVTHSLIKTKIWDQDARAGLQKN